MFSRVLEYEIFRQYFSVEKENKSFIGQKRLFFLRFEQFKKKYITKYFVEKFRRFVKSRNFNFRAYIWSHLPHFPWKFKSWVGKWLKIWGSNPCFRRSKFFCLFVSFHLQILHKTLYIFVFNHFWISCFTKIKTNIFNMFYLISN